ncbi:glutamine cyclotransferase [Sphingomonas zeicaulis]|uniref:Vgb family protein n=1 Tax=Sphingomonas zeicaulis TaxID=1632740 RepID=UPI003D2456C4
MKQSKAEILREYGPFTDVDAIHGVSFDGSHVWFAGGDALKALDPETGEIVCTLPVAAHAGTAFDGTHLFQIAEDRIDRIDPVEGRVVGSIPAPEGGAAGMAWAEGSLWVGQHRARRILEIDPETGNILRSIDAQRMVTGVTWLDGELWHATWEGDQSDIRRIDRATGAVLERIEMPAGAFITGLESDGVERFFCGGGPTRKVRAVRRG